MSKPAGVPILRCIFALVLLLIGLIVAAGGVQLLTLGGSPYYLLGGIAVIVSAILVWRGDARGAALYAAFLIVTLIWAVWEAGIDGWALAPRLIAPAVLGLLFAVPWIRRGLPGRAPLAAAGAATLSLLVVFGVALAPARYVLAAPSAAITATAGATDAPGEWPEWGRTAGGDRHSPLAQITPANIADLKPAWTFHTGIPTKSSFEATPIMVGDSLYLCAPKNVVIALDPETGRQKWRFDPHINQTGSSQVTACRGVAFQRTPTAADCPERIVTATYGGELIALDARTGRLCPSFGTNGRVDLNVGMGKVDPGFYYVSSPP